LIISDLDFEGFNSEKPVDCIEIVGGKSAENLAEDIYQLIFTKLSLDDDCKDSLAGKV